MLMIMTSMLAHVVDVKREHSYTENLRTGKSYI